jgi:hypothetical protein
VKVVQERLAHIQYAQRAPDVNLGSLMGKQPAKSEPS